MGLPETRAGQLDNDVQSVEEMVTRIETTQQWHSNQLEALAGRLDEVAATQATQGAVLDRIVALVQRRARRVTATRVGPSPVILQGWRWRLRAWFWDGWYTVTVLSLALAG